MTAASSSVPTFPKITRRAVSGGEALRHIFRPETLMAAADWVPILEGYPGGLRPYRKLKASEFDLIDEIGRNSENPIYLNPAIYRPQPEPPSSRHKRFTFKKTFANCVSLSMLDADIHKLGGPLNPDWIPIDQSEAWLRYQKLVQEGVVRPCQIWIDGATSRDCPGGCYILNEYGEPYTHDGGVEQAAREWKIEDVPSLVEK